MFCAQRMCHAFKFHALLHPSPSPVAACILEFKHLLGCGNALFCLALLPVSGLAYPLPRQVREACKNNKGFYLGSIGGPAAVLAQDNITKVLHAVVFLCVRPCVSVSSTVCTCVCESMRVGGGAFVRCARLGKGVEGCVYS
jgi:hypothetical protein